MILSHKFLEIKNLIESTYDKIKQNKNGNLADYIPELKKANPDLFGICFVSCSGEKIKVGECDVTIPIESISKVFSLSMAVDELSISEINKKIGNEGSSLPFNSIIACALSKTHTINPFVNQGAMATTSLFFDKNKKKFEDKIFNNMDKFAGRKLHFDKKVYDSESKTHSTNMALAYLLKSYGRFYGNVETCVDVYTSQCSKLVTAEDLAVMASVFANSGIHPFNKKTIISKKTATYVYRALIGEGLYEYSGKWNTDVGCISAKSGVGGGIFIILKGIGGLGIISPPLDKIGNSVRGIQAGSILAKGITNIIHYSQDTNNKNEILNLLSKKKSKKRKKK